MERFIDNDGDIAFNGAGHNGGGDNAGSPDAKRIDVMNSRWGAVWQGDKSVDPRIDGRA